MQPVFGVSYYPEWTDPSEWKQDLKVIKAHGLSVIRMLEFAWTRLEPREGVYTLDWLDNFLSVAEEIGVGCILGTPTATPPAWMIEQYPEMQIELRDGTVRPFGGRRDTSPSSTIYRHFSEGIVEVLAKRYGTHPAVVGWQIDNELIGPEGCPPECHNRDSTWRFRDWLKKKYDSDVHALNKAWGTHFWSHEYANWGEIITPRTGRGNQGHCMDYYRFFSDMHREFLQLQVATLRKHIDARQFITHNCTGILDRSINHRHFAKEVDVIGWDSYRGAAYMHSPSREGASALGHDLYRCMKQAPFWILETNADQTTPAYIAEMVAHGTQGVLYFHYRQHQAGAEQTLRCLADFTGKPYAERVDAVKTLADRPEMKEDLPAALPRRNCAMIFDYDCVHGNQRNFTFPKAMPYLDAVIRMYLPAWRAGLALDVIDPEDDLKAYKLILLPYHHICSERFAEKLKDFVAQGGTLVITAKTCHKDSSGKYHSTLYGPIRELTGATARDDVRPLPRTALTWNDVRFEDLRDSDSLEVADGVDILARFDHGSPALIQNTFGKGRCLLAATVSETLNQKMIELVAGWVNEPVQKAPLDQVGILPHLTRDATWIFNHRQEDITLFHHTVAAGDFVLIDQPLKTLLGGG